MNQKEWSKLPLAVEDWDADLKAQATQTDIHVNIRVYQGRTSNRLNLISKMIALLQEHADEVQIQGVLALDSACVSIEATGPFDKPASSFDEALANALNVLHHPPQPAKAAN